MLRLLLTLFLVIVASLVYGYIRELNPGTIAIHLSPTGVYELSPVSLMLISMATGALIVILTVGVRETRHLILTWRSSRLVRRKEKVDVPLPGGMSLILLSIPPCYVSASDIRYRIAHGLSVSNLLPAPVESYILEQHLYQQEERANRTGI